MLFCHNFDDYCPILSELVRLFLSLEDFERYTPPPTNQGLVKSLSWWQYPRDSWLWRPISDKIFCYRKFSIRGGQGRGLDRRENEPCGEWGGVENAHRINEGNDGH